MTKATHWIAALAAACGAGCAPALDWREFVPEGTDISVAFPCRPDRHARAVVVAGAKAQMQMLACNAGDATFALAFVDVADPSRVAATLAELRATAVSNVRGAPPQDAPLNVRGMTPNEQSARLAITGTLPDGAAVQEHAAFFVRGLRVYQATVIGAAPAPQAIETFIAGLKFAG
ncbi:MAG: hypothetical protein H7Y61_14720 [Rhizobiales bacterium]|nr:hypothetical protein [Rhizobacter sp.]